MSDDESQSGPAETSQNVTHGVGAPKMNDNLKDLKKQRAQLRGKITRSINRVKKCIHQGAEMRKRIEKEIIQIRKDFELARECHVQMYEYVEESQVQAMDNWEDILTNEFYDIEENVEEFLQSFSVPKHANATSLTNEQIYEQSNTNSNNVIEAGGSSVESNNSVPDEIPALEPQTGDIAQISELVVNKNLGSESNKPSEVMKKNPVSVSACGILKPKPNYDLSSPQSFDSWIDNLIEFKETFCQPKCHKCPSPKRYIS